MSQKNNKQTKPELTHGSATAVVHGSHPKGSPTSENCQNDGHHKKHGTFDYVSLGLTILGLAVVIFYTCYAGRQSYWMRKSVENAALSDRPWIGVATDIGIEHPNYAGDKPIFPIASDILIYPNFPYNLIVVTKNYGRTPALRAYLRYKVDLVKLSPYTPNVSPGLKECQDSCPFADTNNEAQFPNGVYQYRTNRMITDQEGTDKWLHFKTALFIYGCVRYKDSSNLDTSDFYQTDFCRYLSLDTPHQWLPCATGNSVR